MAIQGQVSIGDVCISDLQVVSISGNLDPAKYEIKSNSILFKNVIEFIVTDIDNRESKVEVLRKYLFEEIKKEEPSKPTYPITGAQLKLIFPGTEQSRCDEVATLINKYSNKFEINTRLRMAHFLGQIGTETGGLKYLQENTCYSSKDRIKEIFGKTYYCDLFVGYDTDWNVCGTGHPKPCTTNLTSVTPDLVIKDKYVCSPLLIDYTYSCRMGNGSPSSGDGSTFLGKGFIHLTGKAQFENITTLWNNDTENADNQKDFAGKDIAEITNSLEIAMKASMYYWVQNKNISINGKLITGNGNAFADLDDINYETQFVNGGQTGLDEREKIKNKALGIFKK